MEADWEIETGPQAPIIEALWEGFIDLRQSPHRIHELEEARRFEPLAQTLCSTLNPVPAGQTAPAPDSAPNDPGPRNAISGHWKRQRSLIHTS